MTEPIGRKMDKIAHMFRFKLNSQLSHLDINRSFYPLLLIEAGNGITQQQLADQLICDKVQVVRIIDYLSCNGYVERVQNGADKRKYELTITNKARFILPDIKNAIGQATSCALNGLSTDSINEFYKTLSVIERNLEITEL